MVNAAVVIATTGLIMAALGLLPAILGGSLHATMVGLASAHWLLAAVIPFAVAAGAALMARHPEALSGSAAAARVLVAAIVGTIAAEGVFWVVTIYMANVITGYSTAAIRHGHPPAYSWAQVGTVVGLGAATGLLMARAQRRGLLRPHG
jgi:hypothetical protein